MYRISKCFEFSAAHHLPHLPEGHQCRRPHGHNYVVTVELESEALDEDSFVEDYGLLADIKRDLDTVFDHQNLNDIVHPMPTTAERLAEYFYWRWEPAHPRLCAVRVSETPKTWAEFRP